MNKFQELLAAGLIAAVATGAVAGVVIWKTAATQRAFVAEQFAAQNAKIQTVGDELAKTAADLKRLDGTLNTTEATLREVKDQVALVGTRTGIADLNSLAEAANKTLGEIKQATAPDRTEAALAPLSAKLDDANKTLATLQSKFDDTATDNTRAEALARIEATLAEVKDALAKRPPDPALAQVNTKLDDALKSLAAIGKTADTLKGNGTDTAKLDDAAQSLAAIKESIDAIKTRADADAAKLEAASKSIAALDTSVKQGFAAVEAKQADVMTEVAKPAPAPAPSQPAEPKQDLVVFYVAMAGQAAPAPAPASSPPPPAKREPGLTPAVPPPFTVRFERLGKVDDEGQTKLIVDKVRALIEGRSGCTIAVTGHADTFGGDKRNYELSRRRANEVADELTAAFSADKIAITRTPWGERRLAEWTPDGTAKEVNRRVDVAVSCEK